MGSPAPRKGLLARERRGDTLPLAEALFTQALRETAAQVPRAALRGIRLREWTRSTVRVEVDGLVLGRFLAEAKPLLEGALQRLTQSPVKVLVHPAGPVSRGGEFLVADSNRLAARLFLSGETPPLFDPILLYGPQGAGKTHLLQLYVERLRAQGEGHRVRYRTGRGLVRQLQALSFKRDWQRLPAELAAPALLILDGLEALAGAPATQGLLARLLERRALLGGRTVLASRLGPAAAAWLPPLRTRLEAGLVVAIAPPPPEVVTAHLRRRLAARGVRLPEGVVRAAVTAAAGHPWQAETLLLQAYREARAQGAVLDARWLAAWLPPPAAEPAGHARPWLEAVARTFGVSVPELVGPRRLRRLRRPREVAALLLREEAGLTLAEVGEALGGRALATVTQLLRRARAALAGDPELASLVAELRSTGGGRGG